MMKIEMRCGKKGKRNEEEDRGQAGRLAGWMAGCGRVVVVCGYVCGGRTDDGEPCKAQRVVLTDTRKSTGGGHGRV